MVMSWLSLALKALEPLAKGHALQFAKGLMENGSWLSHALKALKPLAKGHALQFAKGLMENGDQNFWNTTNTGGGEAEMQQAWQEFQAQRRFNYYGLNIGRDKPGGIKRRTKNWDNPRRWRL